MPNLRLIIAGLLIFVGLVLMCLER